MDPVSTPPLDLQALATLISERVSVNQLSSGSVEYIVDRLNRIGMYPSLNNFGGIRCIHSHKHDDGTCVSVGPLFDRLYVKVYENAEDGLADLFRIAHHATLSGYVDPQNIGEAETHYGDGIKTCYYCGGPYCVAKCGDLPCCYCGKPWKGKKEETNLSGYRSIEQEAPSESDDVESFVDRLDGNTNESIDGVFADIEDKIVKSAVLSFCRGTLSDEAKVERLDKKNPNNSEEEEKKAGFFQTLKDKVVRGTVVSFCRGEIKADKKAEKADKIKPDKLSGNEIDNQFNRKLEEIAAQWSTLKRHIDSDPEAEKLILDSFNHWINVWNDHVSGKNKISPNKIRSIIYELNMARSVLASRNASLGDWSSWVRKNFDPISDETIARAAELAAKFKRLKEWGIDKKLPFRKETIAVLDDFFSKARKGEIDVTQIVGTTADITKLEKDAEEFDASKNVPNAFKHEKPKTAFDIETSSEGLKAAKVVLDKLPEIKEPDTWKIVAASILGTLALAAAVKVAL